MSAPAGFGKTSAVGDWLSGLGGVPAPRVAWLSLDDGDNDLGRLLTHLGAALDRAGMLTDPTVLDPLAAAPPIAVGA
ncbi:MAG: hypothetical protein ABIS35_12040, partial [Terracoccus sp.]